MSDRPTCQVVKRAGQRGARIHPKGCKLRRTVDKQGKTTRTTRTGQVKTQIAERGKKHRLSVRGPNKQAISFVWDTGATVSTISVLNALKIGLIKKANNKRGWSPDDGATMGPTISTVDPHGKRTPGHVVRDVFLQLPNGGYVRGDIVVQARAWSVYGQSHIPFTESYRVKFR